jgi:uncharacterized membrane protein YkvA (DUF1232 family)
LADNEMLSWGTLDADIASQWQGRLASSSAIRRPVLKQGGPMGVVDGAGAIASAVKASQGKHPLGQRVLAVPAMLWATMRRRWPGAPKGRIFIGIAGIVYLITPIDLMPEAILGPFGIPDDIALAAASVAALLSAAEAYLDMRDAGELQGVDADIIPGVVVQRSDVTG